MFGFAVMLYYFVDTVVRFYPFPNTSDLVTFVVFFLGACAMFLFSSMYHTFMCHSFKVFEVVMTGDYVGIFLMIFGSTLSATHVLLYCYPTMRSVYQAGFGVMCLCKAPPTHARARCPRRSRPSTR